MSGWSVNAPASSIRSAPSYWSVALLFDKACASCALSYHAFSPLAAMSCLRACYASSRIWPATGAGSMSASRDYPVRSRFLRAGMRVVSAIPGIGPIISSAMVAAIGSGDAFTKGRDFAAWLGLVPKQISTGDRTILGKISKRRNRYLRVLFVQAAWVVLIKPGSWDRHGLKPWLEAAKKRLHHNVLAIALANKLARIAWSVLAHGRAFEASQLQVA